MTLEHFVLAQQPVYAQVLSELRAGDKQSHWMWFIFPQLRVLGRSPMALKYGIADLDEAKAYLAHPLLGPRLLECTGAMLGVEGRTAYEILHPPDDLKFRSSMTLFARAATDPAPFRQALAKFYGGQEDPLTLRELPDEPSW